ncbi:MAG TPA: SusC/RagA family TonB-linked outer membrane protein [Puia sp.]|uniref:SusC/RagA family TonB-linked outer membrane protein n=1 Tax=Puia sp. TaxID=2045100 RepID=UPI002C9218E4|nr:SusC/RagA family TonB-linked outer membrane protein [Puia sp.]HVU97793.1 SusC/RagA family TonB-linked outer membrane protein [Puia sp.]
MRNWKLFSLIMFVILSMITNGGMAQTVPITGTVLSEDGTPLAGVTVSVSGTNRATVTDNNGKFTIDAGKKGMLQFSSIGYTAQTLKAAAGMQVRLVKGESAQMGDVVVTALGIRKERKALGYSVTELNADELMKNKNTNVINSMAGKVPGVNITQFSGSAGAGASITIRGGNSTSEGRQNQPLFVIDGVIYDNTTTVTGNTGTDGLSRSNTTFSNRVMDINPEDVATMSVLKGAAAAALYGSRAADGVVIITTKKGAEGALTVSAASKVSTSSADKLPTVQSLFGPGLLSNNGVLNTTTYNAWGPPIPADSAKYDNIGHFFRHGIVYDNNVNVSGGTKNGSFFLSGSNFKQEGIVPKTDYEKTTFRFNGEQRFGRLTVNANVAYSIADIDRTLTTAGLYGSGVGSMQALYSFPTTYNMKNYLNPDGTQNRIYGGTVALQDDRDNPYWIINKDKLTSETKRITGAIGASYKIASWWDVTARLGYDQYGTNDYTYVAPGSALAPLYQNGRLSKDLYNYTYTTTTVMTTLHKTFFNDFDAHLMLGNTTENTNSVTQNLWGYAFIVPGTISFNNIATTNKFFTDATVRRRLVGNYGEAGINYKSIAFLTVTGRNDQSSTLAIKNNSYFYPSVSGSLVFTELMPRSNILSFGKVRGSWARVGKDGNPYATNTYENPAISIGSYIGVGNQYYAGNPNLKPEIQNSWEVGTELRFLNGRINLDYTYYRSQTNNQIGQPRLAQSGGFIFSTLNSGSVINKGMEISLSGKAIATRDFSWDVILNYSYNRGRLGAFIPGVAYFYPTDAQFGTIKAASIPNGGYFLGMTGTPFYRQFDAKGKEIPNGRYQVDPTTGFYKVNTTGTAVVGNREPDFIGGFSNTLRYKNLSFSFLLDIRKGGAVYNGTEYYLVQNGLSKRTLQNGRQSVTVSGVNSVTGADFNQTYTAGQNYTIGSTTYAGAYMIQQYWQNYAVNPYNFITSVNWLKLRSVSLSYDFTSLFKGQKIFKNLSATAVGTNLFTWTNYSGMDPEVSAAGGTGGSGSQGIDYLGVPAVRTITFGINASF